MKLMPGRGGASGPAPPGRPGGRVSNCQTAENEETMRCPLPFNLNLVLVFKLGEEHRVGEDAGETECSGDPTFSLNSVRVLLCFRVWPAPGPGGHRPPRLG